jgi:Clostridium epsilon toxin ETX/Bacillus mosquitocidal toxin MTX2
MKKFIPLILTLLSTHAMAIETLDERLTRMLKNTDRPAEGVNRGSKYLSHNVTQYVMKGEGIASSVKAVDDYLTIDSSTLKNSLDHTVELPVKGFSYTHTDRTSTTNRTGWTFNYQYEATASFNVLFASGGVTHTLGLQYDMSNEKTHEETITKVWSVDPFMVPVPAGKTYKIDYVFTKITVSGNSRLDAELFGTYNYQTLQPVTYQEVDLGAATDILDPSKREGFVTVYGPAPHYTSRGVKQTGTSPFSSVKGVDFFVEIRDVTNVSGKGTLVARHSYQRQ